LFQRNGSWDAHREELMRDRLELEIVGFDAFEKDKTDGNPRIARILLNVTGLTADESFSDALKTIEAKIKERDEREDQKKQQTKRSVVTPSHTPPVRTWNELWVHAIGTVVIVGMVLLAFSHPPAFSRYWGTSRHYSRS
jgi:hypothetical protein